ncbi:hypothetical protein ACQ5A1_004169 [Pseudomonas aeruginosa]
MNKANECSCPSGDGSLVHPCPAHPAVEQAGGDERDFQAEGAQEVPSPVSQEYDRHLISLLRKGEALPGHQEEAADEIERLRDWNDHLNNTVLPNILNPTFLMLMKGGERLLDLCTKDGEFIGVSLNDMKDVFDWMVTHARIAPDQAALAQPSPAIATAPTYQFHSREIGESDWAPCDFSWYLYCSKSPEMDTRVVEVTAQPSPAQAEQAEAERPEGPTEDELEAAGLGYPLHKEEAVKLWYSGFRSEVITVLEAWEAIGHDIGMNPDKGELLDSLRYMLEKCEAHDAALAEVAGLRSLLNSLLCYVERDIDRMRSDRDKSDNKEIYDRSISLAMERLKAAQNAVFTTEPGCDTAVELAAQTTQAQHSVPVAREQLERLVRILDAHNYAKDAEALMALLAAAPAQAQHSVPELLEWAVGRWHAEVSLRPLINVHRRALDDTWRQVIRRLGGDTGLLCGPSHDELLAAAPGTEVPQAWLDVQAERRRQITAEGWTPDHDDLYCAAELPRAAAAYILSGANDEAPAIWPFSAKWWKPRDARSNYVRAGALILAEIERLDRAAPGKEGNDD